MKKSLIVWLIIAVALIIAGIAVTIFGFASVGFDLSAISTDPEKTDMISVDDDFSSIVIDGSTADLKILPSTDGKCTIDLVEREKIYHLASVENGVLKISEKDDRKWYEYIGISWGNMSVTLYLPKAQYDKLSIDMSTADIEIADTLSFNSARIKTSTGDIKLEASVCRSLSIEASTANIFASGVTGADVKIKTSTGGIELSDSACKNLEIESSTGKVKLSDVSGTGSFNIITTTGKITLSDTVTTSDLSIIAETGKVNLERCDAANINIITDTGDVEGSLLSSKIFFYETDTGDVDLPRTTEGGRCNIKTDTGDIKITIQ